MRFKTFQLIFEDEERTPSEVNKIENTEEKTQEPSKEEVEEVVKDKG